MKGSLLQNKYFLLGLGVLVGLGLAGLIFLVYPTISDTLSNILPMQCSVKEYNYTDFDLADVAANHYVIKGVSFKLVIYEGVDNDTINSLEQKCCVIKRRDSTSTSFYCPDNVSQTLVDGNTLHYSSVVTAQ